MRLTIIIGIIFISIQTLECHIVPSSRLNFFDIDLLRYATENKRGNVMLCPPSVKSTLGMLLEGAEGETASEIKSALRVSPMKDDFREELSAYVEALEADSTNYFLRNANALFLSKKMRLKKDYERAARGIYHAEIERTDFTDPKTSAANINNWVYRNTVGLIPTIIDESDISPSTEMIVANALFFKASWKYAFNSKTTHSDCFYNRGVCTNVAMMDLQAELRYAFVDDLRTHALELPYQGGRYSMFLLVPQDRDGDDSLIRDLPFIGLNQIEKMMYPNDVILSLPKFDIEYNEDLAVTLRRLRITSLFSHKANLSGIHEVGNYPYLNSMYHSVHMKVDEEGTIAAAATASLVVPLINNEIQLRVDRPFLFFIKDNKYGLVLFEGRIDEPTEFNAKEQSSTASKNKPPTQPHLDVRNQVPENQNHVAQNQGSQNHFIQNQATQSHPTQNQAKQKYVPPPVGTFIFPSVDSRSDFGNEADSKESSSTQSSSTHSSSTQETSESPPVTSSEPPEPTASVTTEEPKKSGGITGFFKKLGSYF